MTMLGGWGVDKTNGTPEQTGLDGNGSGGACDRGEVPTRACPGEPHSGCGPPSSTPEIVQEDLKMGSDGESEQASDTSFDEVQLLLRLCVQDLH